MTDWRLISSTARISCPHAARLLYVRRVIICVNFNVSRIFSVLLLGQLRGTVNNRRFVFSSNSSSYCVLPTNEFPPHSLDFLVSHCVLPTKTRKNRARRKSPLFDAMVAGLNGRSLGYPSNVDDRWNLRFTADLKRCIAKSILSSSIRQAAHC